MKAALYEAFGQHLCIQNVPDPTPVDDAVVIRVKACGIAAVTGTGGWGMIRMSGSPMCLDTNWQGS